MTRYTLYRFLTGGSRFISAALSPLLMPTYGTFLVLWTSILCALPVGTRATVLAMVMGITCVLPMIVIGVMHHFGFITNKRLTMRRERIIPYVFAVLCYAGATAYLYNVHAPTWFILFMAGATLAVTIALIVTVWWKISAHMTGMGGLTALVYQVHVQGLSAFDFFGLLCATLLLSGVLGSARMVLKRHDVLQVVAGFLNGYVCVTLAMKLFD